MKQTFRLDHARAGENYTGRLSLVNESEQRLTFLDIKIPPGLELTPNLASGTLSGVVSEPGEFDITVKFFKNGKKPLREEDGIATLLVVPNPKLMWKNIPSPRNEPYWAPDEKHSLTVAAGLKVIAASKRGRSHAHAGSFRDDDYAVASDGEWLIAIVADGAGSARYSRMGAKLACDVASRYLLENLPKITGDIETTLSDKNVHEADMHANSLKKIFAPLIKASLECVLGAIKNEFEKLQDGSELREFSTTTLITIARKINNAILVVTYSVGDGAIALYQEKAQLNLLSCGDSGEYAGQTRFLDHNSVTLEEVLRRSSVTIIAATTPAMPSLLMMTDGVSDPFFETENQLLSVAQWDLLWQNLNEEKIISGQDSDCKLLQWLDFWSKGNHDDRTIIIITQE